MTTKGITRNGKEIDVPIYANDKHSKYKNVQANGLDLISLEVPEGITDVMCNNNHLTHLHLPDSVEWVMCDPDLFDYEKCKVLEVYVFYL
jgi:hypothetical protein